MFQNVCASRRMAARLICLILNFSLFTYNVSRDGTREMCMGRTAKYKVIRTSKQVATVLGVLNTSSQLPDRLKESQRSVNCLILS